MIHPIHPQAQLAIWLAGRLAGCEPNLVTYVVAASGCPRRLFVLASVLRAAQGTEK